MTPPPFWLTTTRLALRRFTPADLDWLAALRKDPEVMRHAGGPQTRADTIEMLRRRVLDYYEAHPGLGIWMTADRSTGTPVGFHLLNNIRGEAYIQVGFFLVRPAWGQGFGTEMASALLQYGFVERHLPQIVGIAALDNHASHHVLTKIGLRRRGERVLAHPTYSSQGPLAWFERSAADWLAAQSGRRGVQDLA